MRFYSPQSKAAASQIGKGISHLVGSVACVAVGNTMILYQTATVKELKTREGHSGPHSPVWVHASSCACSSVLDTLLTIASYYANGARSQHAFCGARLKQLVPGHKAGPAVLDVWVMAQAFHGRDSARLVGVRIVTERHHQTWSHALHVGHSIWMDGNHLAPTMLELDLKLCAGNFLHHHRSAFRDGVRAAREVLVLLSSDVVTSLQQLEGKGRHSIHALCC